MKSRNSQRSTSKTRSEFGSYDSLEPKNLLAGDLSSTVAVGSLGSSSLVYQVTDEVAVEDRMQLLREHLGLESNEELRFLELNRDQLGFGHIKYQQFFEGYEVLGGVYSAHVKDRIVEGLSGDFKNIDDVETTATVSNTDALQHAIDHIGADAYIWDNPEFFGAAQELLPTERPEGELVVVQVGEDQFELAYQFDIIGIAPLSRAEVYVDATSGEVLAEHSLMQGMDVPATGISLYDGQVDFTATEIGAEYILFNESPGVQTLDLQGGFDFGDAVDHVNNSPNFNDPSLATGVQTHYGAEQTYLHALENYGYDSYDNMGTTMLSYTSFGNFTFNAFWFGDFAVFGDGNGTSSGPLVSLDIVGHEFYHGFTQESSGLVYAFESGALNESFSDIFGKVVENYARGSNNWLLGDDIGLVNSGAIRNMENPNQFSDPDTYLGDFWWTSTGDNGGVHTNSGVQNKWFQLLTDGGIGTNDNGDDYDVVAVGIDEAAAIAFRNLTVYLTPDSQFIDAREGAIQAAIDLYGFGSQQMLSTMEAWDAVGVYDPIEAFDLNEGMVRDISPEGSLIYRADRVYEIETLRHRIDINVDPNQAFTIKLSTESGLEANVQLATPDGQFLFNDSFLNGDDLIQQGLSSTVGGTYELFVDGGETTGEYFLEFWLNTNLEIEGRFESGLNDSLETAQDIESSAIPMGPFSDRLAVIGTFPGDAATTSIVGEDFESGELSDSWTTNSSTEGGRILVTGLLGSNDGDFALLMDQTEETVFNLNEAIWTVDVSGFLDPVLQYSFTEYNDETHPLPDVFTGSFEGDGVSISEDGETWYTIQTGEDVEDTIWFDKSFALSELAASTGLALNEVIYVKFQQYDDFAAETDGLGFDSISIESPATGSDWYSFYVDTSQVASVVATGFAPGTIRVDVLNSEGEFVLVGTSPESNVDSTASQFVGEGETYYARVQGVVDYSLVVTRGIDFDIDPNNSIATAQDITDTYGALGYVADKPDLVAEPDDFADGDNISNSFPGVTLSNDLGIEDSNVYAVDATEYGAPTGDLIFSPNTFSNTGWNEFSSVFRADFAQPQAVVSIDVGADDDEDRAFLKAYGANDEFLGIVESNPLVAGDSETLTISFETNEIVYILAAGIGGDVTPLDNLVYQLAEYDVDYYSFEASAGEEINLSAILPGGGPGLFNNGLSSPEGSALRVELISPSGISISTSPSTIDHVAEESGTYIVYVSPEFDTSGEYLLRRELAAVIPDIGGVDFGPDGSDVFEDFVEVTADEYQPYIGYGWTSTDGLTSFEESRGTDLTKDKISLREGTFVINVENGTYDVNLYFGQVRSKTDNVTVTIEGETDVFKPTAGPNVIRSYVATVADGQLTIDLSGSPGLDRVLRLSGIDYSLQQDRSFRGGDDNGGSIGDSTDTVLGSRLQLSQPVEGDSSDSRSGKMMLPSSFTANGLSGSVDIVASSENRISDRVKPNRAPIETSVDELNQILVEEFELL